MKHRVLVTAAIACLTGGVASIASAYPGVVDQPTAREALAAAPASSIGRSTGDTGAPAPDRAGRSAASGRPSASAPARTGAPAGPRQKYDVLVIGHRGAPSYRPQHTLEGYQLAIDQGAEYIEPDVVVTHDGHLVARHESDLTETTDIRTRPEFAARVRADGRWYAEDLMLAEIKTLRAVGGPAEHSGRYEIPTIEEVLALLRRQQRTVGLYVEMKEPAHFRRIGLPQEERLATALRDAGLSGHDTPVFVESADPESLLRMHALTDVRLTQLVWGGAKAAPITDAQLTQIAWYASAIGVDRERLLADAFSTGRSALVERARANGLDVHLFTFGSRNPFGAPAERFAHPDDPEAWAKVVPMYRAFYALGVSAVFTDAPDIAIYARG